MSSKRTTPAVVAVPPISAEIPITSEGPVSFKQFQSDLLQLSKQLQHKGETSPPSADNLKLQALSLTADEVETDDDGRSLEDRLTDPNPTSSAAIAALLARHLALTGGELVLQLAAHNLTHKTLVSLLEDPDPELPLDTTTAILPREKVGLIVKTLTAAADDAGAELSISHNPFDEAGRLAAAVTPDGQTFVPSCVNDEAVEARWRGRALRLLVRRRPESASDIQESRVAVVGNVDAGKSSLLGVLTKGRLDDGRGRARVSLFRHKHEIESGRTSSVGMELLGFSAKGVVVLPESHVTLADKSAATDPVQGSTTRKQQLSWEEISSKSAKIVSFADLAGHERYLKTTLFGLTATSPDFVLLIVGGNAGLIGMSKEHLSVALALSVPVVCVITKVDMTPPNILEQTVKQLAKVLRSPGCRKQPVFVKDVGMACELAANFVTSKQVQVAPAQELWTNADPPLVFRACPIFLCSNVTGEGLGLVRTFLNVVPPAAGGRYPVDEPLHFSISDVFSVPFVGTVVSGVILAGKVAVGDNVLLGPDSLGAYVVTAIKSIQRKRVNVLHAEAGQSVSYALKRVRRAGVRKGQVILAKTDVHPTAVRRFEGQVLVLYHNTTISKSYQAMLHCGSVRQTVQIDSIIEKPSIRTGDRATVQFSFIKHSEHISLGDRFLFREGRTRALGLVTRLIT